MSKFVFSVTSGLILAAVIANARLEDRRWLAHPYWVSEAQQEWNFLQLRADYASDQHGKIVMRQDLYRLASLSHVDLPDVTSP
jgi:hypothetical protein